MARPQKTPALPAHTDLDQERIEGAAAAMRQDSQADRQQDLSDVYALGEIAGSIKAFGFCATVSLSAQIAQYEKVKKSKAWRILPNPKSETRCAFTSLDEYCEVAFGKQQRRIQQLSANARLLGQEAFEQGEAIGLRQVDYNAIKALPAPDRELVRQAVEEAKSRDEVVGLLEELAARLSASQAENAELKADAEAQAQVRADLHQKLDKERAKLKRISKLPPNQQLAELHKEAGLAGFEAQAVIMGTLRPALQALADMEEAHGSQNVVMAGLVGQVQAALSGLREQFNLPDVSNAADLQLAAEVAEWAK